MNVLARFNTAVLAVRSFFAGRVLRVFARELAIEPPLSPPAVKPLDGLRAVGPGAAKGNSEELGRWRFRGQILDNLDGYFKTLRSLAAWDTDLYHMTTRIGSVLVPPKSAALHDAIDLPKGQEPPSFGSFFWPPEKHIDGDNPRFLAFHRVCKPLPHIEQTNRPVYEITLIHQREDSNSLYPPQRFYCALNADGTARLLRERRPVAQDIMGKRGRFTIHHGRGKLMNPWILEKLSEVYKVKRSPEEIGQTCFCWTANLLIQAQMSLRVSIERRGLIAAFHIDTERTPYFFSDRDAIPGKRRKKIFHIVRTHERTTTVGKTTFVRSHFRGERKFTWNDYDVTISMPGLHHADLLAMKVDAMHVEDGETIPPDTYTAKQAGNLIRQHLLH